jgi:FimV-like protein
LSFKTKRDEAFELSARLDITKQTFKTFLTIFLLIPTLIMSVNLYRNESNMIKVRSLFKPGSNLTNSPDFKNYGDKIFEAKLIEPSYLVNTAGYYAVMGDQTKAFEILNEVVMKNPRNQDALFILADFKRQIKDFSDAADYFEEIAKIDPWNVTNFFSLAEAYVELGDNGKAQESLFKILDITNNYDQRKRASDLLAKLN